MKSGGMGMSSTGGVGFNDGSKFDNTNIDSPFTTRTDSICNGYSTDNCPPQGKADKS